MVTLADGIKEFQRILKEEERREAEYVPEGPQAPPHTSRESYVAAEAARVAAGDWGEVFVYGMLMAPAPWGALLGRVPKMRPAMLKGYDRVRVAGCTFAGITEAPGGLVIGTVISGLMPEERRLMDSVVDDGFDLTMGIYVEFIDFLAGPTSSTCSMYVWKEAYSDGLTEEAWDYEAFCDNDLLEFVALCEDRRTAFLAEKLPDDDLKELAMRRRRREGAIEHDDDEDSNYRSEDEEDE